MPYFAHDNSEGKENQSFQPDINLMQKKQFSENSWDSFKICNPRMIHLNIVLYVQKEGYDFKMQILRGRRNFYFHA